MAKSSLKRGVRARNQRVYLLEPDPYLSFLIGLEFPQVEVIQASLPAGDPHATPRPRHGDAAIVNLANPRSRDFIASMNGCKTIAIVDATASGDKSLSEADEIVLDPFVPAELYRAVRNALGIAKPEGSTQRSLQRTPGWLAAARIAALALAAVTHVGGVGSAPWGELVLATSVTFAVFRLAIRRTTTRTSLVDVTVAALLMATTGGQNSNFTPFGLVAVFGAGMTWGVTRGAIGGLLLGAAPITFVAYSIQPGQVSTSHVSAWVMLFPLAAVIGAMTVRINEMDQPESIGRLAEANRTLSMLYRLARSMPGGLDLDDVALAAMEEVRETLKSRGAILLVQKAGMLSVAGSFGLRDPDDIVVETDDEAWMRLGSHPPKAWDLSQLPSNLRPFFEDHECWLSTPVCREGFAVGLLMAACPDHPQHDASLLFLQHLADETAVAVENARLFGKLRDLSIDEERRRLARELHDGVAQSLTHIRMELEFLALRGSATGKSVQAEAARLAQVAARSVRDVRRTIRGLLPDPTRGLSASLRTYVHELSGAAGPTIDFASKGSVELPPEDQAEVFRVGQEALSNAMRHSKAGRITVELNATDNRVVLAVVDNGIGISEHALSNGGLGLKAMRERAKSLDARLSIVGTPQQGTHVELEVAQ